MYSNRLSGKNVRGASEGVHAAGLGRSAASSGLVGRSWEGRRREEETKGGENGREGRRFPGSGAGHDRPPRAQDQGFNISVGRVIGKPLLGSASHRTLRGPFDRSCQKGHHGSAMVRPRVVVVRSGNVWTASGGLDPAVVARMLDRGLDLLAGEGRDPAAAAALFRPDDRVGIKVNTIGGRAISTRPEVALALARRLAGTGIPENNLIIWDRTTRELRDGRVCAGHGPERRPGLRHRRGRGRLRRGPRGPPRRGQPLLQDPDGSDHGLRQPGHPQGPRPGRSDRGHEELLRGHPQSEQVP